jgi:predicted ATPase
VTEINITTDRKEQVRLFIIMAASLQSDKISIGPYGDFLNYLNYFFDNFYSDM